MIKRGKVFLAPMSYVYLYIVYAVCAHRDMQIIYYYYLVSLQVSSAFLIFLKPKKGEKSNKQVLQLRKSRPTTAEQMIEFLGMYVTFLRRSR
jgi:hypothetical protein